MSCSTKMGECSALLLYDWCQQHINHLTRSFITFFAQVVRSTKVDLFSTRYYVTIKVVASGVQPLYPPKPCDRRQVIKERVRWLMCCRHQSFIFTKKPSKLTSFSKLSGRREEVVISCYRHRWRPPGSITISYTSCRGASWEPDPRSSPYRRPRLARRLTPQVRLLEGGYCRRQALKR